MSDTVRTVIETRGVGKEFNGVWVLKDIDFELREGEIHALVGENGAGKSTFIKILSGVYGYSAGSIFVNGEQRVFHSVPESEAAGIRTVHQEINIVAWLKVYENIFLGAEIARSIAGLNVLSDKEMIRRADEAVRQLKVNLDVTANADRVSPSMKKIIEICKVLIYSPNIIIFDEPTTSLSKEECDSLLEVIRELRRRGISIIYISHNLDEVKRIADRVTVFRDGAKIGTLENDEVQIDRIVNMMLGGKKYEAFARSQSYATDEVVLEMDNVFTDKLRGVSLRARKGEILGIAGVVGAGKTETARAIFGIDHIKSGKIRYKGRNLRGSTRDSIKRGIALVPEERQAQGLVLSFDVTANTTLAFLDKWCHKTGYIFSKKEHQAANEFIEKLGTKTAGCKQVVRYLSGGNQQKVVLSKWLSGDFELGLFDDPCRGIDIKAKEDIYLLMDQLAREGRTIIMMSGYMPELINNCDRIVVMHEGEVVSEFEKGIENYEEKILTAMLGGSAQ